MNYTEILADAVAISGRPDLTTKMAVAVRAATLRMHQSDYYVRDLVERKIVVITPAYIHEWELAAVFTRYRALKYLRKWDPVGIDANTGLTTGCAGEFFKILDPTEVLDGYGATKSNVAYATGAFLNVHSNTSDSQFLASWYQAPRISPVEQYSSWIAAEVPYAVIFDACSILFNTIGEQETSRKFDTLVTEQVAMVRMAGLQTKGY